MNLILGDCIKEMAHIETGSIDMVLADPPYGMTACEWDSIIPLDAMWEQLNRLIKPNGAIAMTASQPFATTLICNNRKMFRYEYVWLKERGQNFASAKKQFMRAHENVLIFYNRQPTYNPQMTDAISENIRRPQYHTAHKSEVYGMQKMPSKDYDRTKRYPLSYGFYKTGRARDKIHPVQKPVSLMEYLIKTYTLEGDTVLDFAMGSGTTGVACKNLNREFIGIEIEEKYFNMAKRRILEQGVLAL